MTTQRTVQHTHGTFPQCPRCQREPRHMLDVRRQPIGGHWLECPCNVNGLRYPTLERAIREWCGARGVAMSVRAYPKPTATVLHMPGGLGR